MILETDPRQSEVEPRLPIWRTLDGFVSKQGSAEGVAIETLHTGASLQVHTRHSDYRLVVIDGPNHLVQVEGGAVFPTPTIARLDGATAGGSVLKMGWLEVGLRMELSQGRRRITSSRVESIQLESPHRLLHSLLSR